jgi:NAD(P)-dependent dehydrogenase (short-subunit alcohol dehydrogenase family)
MSEKWTAAQIPSQSGRTAVVTGANSGLGEATARELARAGAEVVLACRNTEKADAAAAAIRETVPSASVSVEPLDLADLSSIRAFAGRFSARRGGLDLLINNAGVMAPPRSETADGFELQFGTNHLGHFALTGLLLGALEGREDARVVTVSSSGHKVGRMRFDDLQGEHRYWRWNAYCQSKLANLLFMRELERRLRAAGSTVSSFAAHPGYSDTNLQYAAPPALERAIFAITNRLAAQGADFGALPTLYAATLDGLEGGTYVGPDGFAERAGFPKPVKASRAARDDDAAKRLWEISEELTGVDYEALAAKA